MADQSTKGGFDNLTVANWKSQFLLETLNAMQQNVNSSMCNNEQGYTSQNTITQSTIMENQGNNENFANWNRGTNQNESPTTTSAIPQEYICHKQSSQNQLSQSYLQNKITEDDLFHKKAARKFAELEVQLKALELERLQWELQRDRYQSDIRWAFEFRMMQYHEEKMKLKLMENV